MTVGAELRVVVVVVVAVVVVVGVVEHAIVVVYATVVVATTLHGCGANGLQASGNSRPSHRPFRM